MSRSSGTYNVSSGSNIGDAAWEAQERANEAALAMIKAAYHTEVDYGEMILVEVIDPENDTKKIAVSLKQGFVQLEEKFIQIGTIAPIGRFIYENRQTLKAGDILPNGYEVVSVGTITLPTDFKPYRMI